MAWKEDAFQNAVEDIRRNKAGDVSSRAEGGKNFYLKRL
jgi:hypothetical protein